MFYDYGSVSTLFGALLGIFIGLIIIVLILCTLIVIGKWKILKKGGKNGWEALIPFYGDWEICKLVGVCPYWIFIMIAIAIIQASLEELGIIIWLLVNIVSLYFKIIFNVSISKSFGKDPAYAIGLILLPWIFYPMLGLGSSEYTGANPMRDVIFDAFNNNATTQQNTNTNQPVNPQVQNVNTQSAQEVQPTDATEQEKNAFCTNCGAPLTDDSTFCTNCGTKVN